MFLSNSITHTQGRNEAKGGTIPLAPNHYEDAESLRRRRMTAQGAEKTQQCHKYFLQCSTFASKRPQVRTGAPNLFFAPDAI